MAKRQTQVWRVAGRLKSDGTGTLKTNQLRGGQLFCVQAISVRNLDTKSPDMFVGFDRDGELYHLDTKRPTHKGYAQLVMATVWIPSEYQVRVDFTGAGNNDRVEMYVYGYLTDGEAGPKD